MKSKFISAWITSKQSEKEKWTSINEVRDSLLLLCIKKQYPKVLQVNELSLVDMLVVDCHSYWLGQSGIEAVKYDFKNETVIFNTSKVLKYITSAKIRMLDDTAEIPTAVKEREEKEKSEQLQAKYSEHSQILSELGIEIAGMVS